MTAACSGDDSSSNNASTGDESGTGGNAGRTGSAGDRGGTSTAGRVAAAGGSAVAGRSSLPDAGAMPAAGSGGISILPPPRAGTGARAGTGGIAGRSGSNAPQAGNTAQAGAGGTQAAALTDGQVASVLLTADAGEVQQNMVALTKATAPAASAFAQDLIDMHSAAQLRLNTLLTTLNITAQASPTGDDLLKASNRIVAKLQAEPGVTFDMAYVQSQIDVHLQVLDLIDRTLLPNAKNEQLRNEIAVVRGEVALHLARARALAAELNLDVDAGVGGDIDAG